MTGPTSASILVVDVGTSGVRAAVVRPDATLEHVHHVEVLPSSPFPGLVEFDPVAMADAALTVARAALAAGGPVGAVGITNQRASAIVWDADTGEPVGPGLGWQDLRTIGECLVLAEQGTPMSPSLSATKFAHLLDAADPERRRSLRVGTVDTWIARALSGGELHVTDPTNAALTGLTTPDAGGWRDDLLATLRIPAEALATVVDSSGFVGEAGALDGSPPIAGIAGDQQASLLGQGCVVPGVAKITFGTGGMLDTVVGPERPSFAARGPAGCFPIVTWRRRGELTWGVEAMILSAGTNIEWLRDDMGLITSAAESHDVAASVPDTDGVFFVPALLGLGTPVWDYGARGTLLGVTRGTTRAHVVRAVLEGIAHRGADLVEAAEADGGQPIATLRLDGGMAANPTFVQAVADATARPVEVSPVLDATTLGAGFLAGLATGTWGSLDEVAGTWRPQAAVEPARPVDRDRWIAARDRSTAWYPELTALDF